MGIKKGKIIKDYEDYSITREGKVFSYKTSKEKELKLNRDKDGYLLVNLFKFGKGKTLKVHRIVAETYIPNTKNKPQVNHINEIKDDNKLENIEWVTCKENINHGTRNERHSESVRGEKNHCSKIKKYYTENSTRRGHFKESCVSKCWNFNDFEEVFSGEMDGKNRKYYYFYKGV
jgi:hypothetical protein